MSTLKHFLSELRRRRVYRVAIVYAAVAFAVWQVADIALPGLGLPETAVTLVVVLTLLGFPVALVLAWAYELKPEEPAPPVPPREAAPSGAAASESRAQSAAAVRTSHATAPPGSIAVLPFENMSTEDGSEYFADGISEELTHVLGRMPSLRVAARTSAFSFKGRGMDVREIGARLNVSHIVEGSVRRAGSRLRVTAQLIETGEGYHIWSDRFERELDDVFAIQDDIVAAVVASLTERLQVTPERRVPTLVRTENLGAYDLYLQGRHAMRRFDGGAVATAVDLFQRTTSLDPDFAPGYAALAEALTTEALGFFQGSGAELLPRARAAAERAITLDPNLPEAHVARALSLMYHDWSFREARVALEEAARLNPSYVDAHRWAEFYWTYVEHDYERAVASLVRARALDPLDPRLILREATIAYIFGHYAQAETVFRELLAEDPPPPIAHIGLMDTLVRAGREQEAAALARQVPLDAGAPDVLYGVTGLVLAQGGAEDEARERLSVLESRRARGYSLPFWRAMIHAGLGEIDQAFARFEEAVEEKDGGLLYLGAIPTVDGLQSDPRFGALLRRVGLGHLVSVL